MGQHRTAWQSVIAFAFLLLAVRTEVAAPTFVAAGTFGSGTGTLNSWTLPAGWAQNDILVLAVQSSNQAITAPAGYTEIGSQANKSSGTAATAGANRLAVFWKRATSSESVPSIADSGDHTCGQIYAFRGCETSGNPWDFQAETVVSTASSSSGTVTMFSTSGWLNGTNNPSSPTSTSVDSTLLVFIVANSNDATSTTMTAQGTGIHVSSITLGAGASGSATNSGTGGGVGMAYSTNPTTAGVALSQTGAPANNNMQINLSASATTSGQVIALKPPAPVVPAFTTKGNFFIFF